MPTLIYPDESYNIMGACFEVYSTIGCGFTEPIYQECLEHEFEQQGIPFNPQAQIPMRYKNMTLKHTFVPDFVCYDKIIVEIKALRRLNDEHRAQMLNYLNATQFNLGLLVNFGHYPNVEYERIVFTSKSTSGTGN